MIIIHVQALVGLMAVSYVAGICAGLAVGARVWRRRPQPSVSGHRARQVLRWSASGREPTEPPEETEEP